MTTGQQRRPGQDSRLGLPVTAFDAMSGPSTGLTVPLNLTIKNLFRERGIVAG